jgi:hypothetical protein
MNPDGPDEEALEDFDHNEIEDEDDPRFDPVFLILQANPELAYLFEAGDKDACKQVASILRRENPREFSGLLLPTGPTDAPAGSLEKIAIMRKRVDAGFRPFHPDDAGPDSLLVSKIIEVSGNGAPMRAGILTKKPQEKPPKEPKLEL